MNDQRIREADARARQRRAQRQDGAAGSSAQPADEPSAATNASSGGSGAGAAQKAKSSSPWPMRIGIAAAAAFALIAGGLMLGGGGDNISEAETNARQDGYEALIAGGSLQLDMVEFAEIDAAVETMSDDPQVREEIKQEIAQGAYDLAWVSLWDTHAEDGDILRFEASTARAVEVMALNNPTTLAIPYPAEGVVVVTGVKDGGGGITIALKSGATEIAWPTMQEGQKLDLPVTPGY